MKFSEEVKVLNCARNEIPNIGNDTVFLYFSKELHEPWSWMALIYENGHIYSAC